MLRGAHNQFIYGRWWNYRLYKSESFTVYVKSNTSANTTYTATVTNAAGCSASKNVTVNIGASPVVTEEMIIVLLLLEVQLTANSTPAATSYLWSTGETTQIILVDVSGIYSVTAYSGGLTCPGKGTINVANELVYNGNFELGNVGFTSAYPYRTTAGSLNSPPGYAVDTAANYYGTYFFMGQRSYNHPRQIYDGKWCSRCKLSNMATNHKRSSKYHLLFFRVGFGIG